MHAFALIFGLVLAANSGICNGNDHNQTVEVHSPLGEIKGSLMTSLLGRTIYSFRGVRYAEPPTGPRRFKQAVPVRAWDTIFDATEEGPACPQPSIENQSEDCLRLNVYSTELPNSGKERKVEKPVIVFFHPGAFYAFSGQSMFLGPQYLMDQEIVLVTVNYRLGSLGFLSTGDSVAPGNLGLKDQVEALRWVRKNIAAFGGDPNLVTISGYSAGSWSVSLHLLSPMSRGLFQRAIAMSGSALYQTPLQPHQWNLAVKQAEILGCPSVNTSTEIVDCLNTKDGIEIGATLSKFFEWNNDPVLLWAPVVEPEIEGVERFLTSQPSELFKARNVAVVPVLTGISKDEFGGNVITAVEEARKGNTSIFDDLNENWDHIAPISFLYERDTNRSKYISQTLRQAYFQDQPIGLSNYKSLAHLYADALVIFNVNNFVKTMVDSSIAPVYYYEFAYQGRYSHAVWSDTKKPFGVVHHDELLYLFWDKYFPYFSQNDPEYNMIAVLTRMWANFAKTGQPISRQDPMFHTHRWIKYDNLVQNYFYIGNDEMTLRRCLYQDRMRVWEELFPLSWSLPKEYQLFSCSWRSNRSWR